MTDQDQQFELRKDAKWLAIIAICAFAVFANSLSGEFVYDDNRQIVMNPLIQVPELIGKALTSDVWAFKGDGSIAASNYWRPTFTAWSILNYRLFGLFPAGWHFTNVLLHVLACVLAFVMSRRWGLEPVLALMIALIFAVHPVHSESVAWIAGSPDLLLSVAFLGSIYFFDRYLLGGRRSWGFLSASILTYCIALGAKETAIMLVPVFGILALFRGWEAEKKSGYGFVACIKVVMPFAVAAIAYFGARWMVLGELTHPVEDATDSWKAILSVPSICLFYLKQLVFPITLAENYPIRPAEFISIMNVVLPLVITVTAAICFWILGRSKLAGLIGIALLVLPMLPVMNITAFPSDQIVHDRYLYLPLFGFLLILLPPIWQLLNKKWNTGGRTIFVSGLIVIAALLAIRTIDYNRVWSNGLTLWAHNARIDPRSVSTLINYASVLAETGRTREAADAFTRAIQVRPNATALVGRARMLLAMNRLDESTADLESVIAMDPANLNAYTLFQAYEVFAIVLMQQNRLDDGEKKTREAIIRLPIYRAALTDKLAVILYVNGKKDVALRELEAVRPQARVELLPASKTPLYRLGALYEELGRKSEAVQAYTEYLDLTKFVSESLTQQDRRAAAEALKRLR